MASSNRKVTVTLDTYLSILAVVSSFCAIGITLYQAYLQRIQQYASVTPILDTYNTSFLTDGTSGYALLIINNGLGPAFIEEVSFYVEKKKYLSTGDFERALLKDTSVVDSTSMISDLWKGRVVAQGERFALIETKNKVVEHSLRKNMERAQIQILYRSIYGEKWLHTYSPDVSGERNRKVE